MRATFRSPIPTPWLSSWLAGAFALAMVSLLGCSSDSSGTAGAPSGGKVTASGGVAGGVGSGGAATGGTVATGGRTSSGGGTVGEGGAGSGGALTSTSTGGSNRDGGATGGAGGTTAAVDAGAGGRVSPDGAIAVDGTSADATLTSTGGTIGTGGSTGTGGKIGTGGATSPGTGADGGLGGSDGKAPITVWMAGDSTMAGDTCTGGGWGDQLGSLFNGNVEVDNRSVAGRSIQTWLYEKNVSSTIGTNKECTLTATTYSDNWNAMLNATSGMKKGDYLIVEFGINDGDSACPRHVGTTLFQTYLAAMAKAAKDRGAQPIFLTSTSYIACSGQTATANRGFIAETKAAGTANDVPVIDMSALSAAMYTKQGLCPNSADYTSTTSKVGVFFCNDHTHFAEPGAIEIARVATTALVNQSIGLASFLK